jgi:hypothetical protein
MGEKVELGVYLKEKISEWQSKGHKNTLLVLSNRTKIGYSTVRRIATGEGANMQTFLQLAAILLHPDEAKKRLYEFFPETRRSIERSFQFLPDAIQHDPIRSKKAFLAVALACPDPGIHIDELKNALGNRDSDALDDLFDANILWMNPEGIVKLAADYYFSPDPYRVTRWIGWASELFDHKNADQQGNFTCLRIEGLNKQAIAKLEKLFGDTERAMNELISDPKNKGEQSITMAMMTSLNRK